MFKFTFFVCLWGSSLTLTTAEIKNLIGEPDYRKVKLHWETDGSSDGFQIRYCELQSWGAQRCRIQVVDDSQSNFIEDGVATYTTDVNGLRMATTYSFEVKRKYKETGVREDRADGDDKNQNIIVIPTKGFSAKATQCLPHASEIEVQTGPYFGGRIAVEAADGERCAIDGEPNSQRDSYILRINHLECGSQVNDTTVATFVIVQENLPILTHSTRRFLVLCTYQPETLTVRAGINLPSNRGHGYANVALEDNSMRQARSRTGRLLQTPQALVHQEDFHEIKEPEDNNVLPIALIAVLMVAVIAGFVAIVLKWNLKRIQDDFDNVSMASDLSTTSYATSTNVEVVNERRQ